jgi:competence protein ComEC
MAISGLHIGLAAGGAWLMGWVLIAPFCRWRNLRDGAALVALCSAAAYASVSGFAVPAQRAVIMALLVIGAGLLRRQLPAARVLALAMITVFLADPLSILAPGFKLSFAAVAILLWSARQRPTDRIFAYRGGDRLAAEIAFRLPPLQLTLLLGLLPLTALSFGHVAWLAPVVNLLILPLFNFLIVPAALLGSLFDGPLAPAGDLLLRVSWYGVRSALALVAAVADWPAARANVATSGRLVPPVRRTTGGG